MKSCWMCSTTFRLYEGAYHFLDWETNREEVFTDCVQWLEGH